MKATSVLGIVLGILVIIGGVFCLVTPVETYLSLAWILGAVMLVDGIFNIVNWSSARRLGAADGWSLASAIISLVFGIIVLGSLGLQLAVDIFIAYMAAFWIIFMGVMRIIISLKIRQGYEAYKEKVLASKWYVPFIFGILLVLLGIFSLFNPLFLMASIGIVIGGCLVVAGVSIISLAF